MTDHKHEMNRFVTFPDGRTMVTCEICTKSKETIVDERIESIEGAIAELNDVMMQFSRDIRVLSLRFQAFVDIALAYSKAAAQDIDMFNELDGSNVDGDTEIKEE